MMAIIKSKDSRIYPCDTKSCKVMRTAAEGGSIFNTCDKCRDKNSINKMIRDIAQAAAETSNKVSIDAINKELACITITTELFTTIIKAILKR